LVVGTEALIKIMEHLAVLEVLVDQTEAQQALELRDRVLLEA
jgi:hypothetical protein